MPFSRLAILGTGLIGSSLGLAVKAARPEVEIIGYDASGENVRGAQRVKAIDRAASMRDAVSQADLVVLSTPVGAMRIILEELGRLVKPGTIITDTGSAKARVLEWARASLPEGVHFVGGHPMAGKTETGPAAADAKLFQGAVWCVVPSPNASREAVDTVVKLAESVGASPYFLDADEHDGLVASVSHLPYLMSVALITAVANESSWREAASLAAGGFAYGTHLTESDPRMFADILRANRENVVRRIDLLVAELERLRERIAAEDPSVKDDLERAQRLHQDWLSGRAAAGGESAAAAIPSSRSVFMGSLLGRLGKTRDEQNGR